MKNLANAIQPSFHTFAYGSFATWAPCYPLEETLRRVASIGYPGVEIGAARPHAWPWDLDAQARQTVRSLLRELHLSVSAICPISHNYNLASSIENERKDALEYYKACIHLAADLEAPILVTVPGWQVFGTSFEQTWNWSREAIRRLAIEAGRVGVFLALEPICSAMVNLVTRSALARQMLDEIGEPAVKLMLDTAHMRMENEDPVEAVATAGQHLVHVHAEDSDGHSLSRRPPGNGDFSWTNFIHALRQSGYSGYLSAEIFGKDADQLAADTLIGLKKVLETP